MNGYYLIYFRCPRCGDKVQEVWHRRKRPVVDTRCGRCWREHGRAVSLIILRVRFDGGPIPIEKKRTVWDRVADLWRRQDVEPSFGGIPIVVDPTMPDGQVDFVNREGRIVGRIINAEEGTT